MILAVVCFILATVISIILWQNVNGGDWRYKGIIILGYILVLGICSQYINLSKAVGQELFEGFEVQIPELDDDNGHNTVKSPDYNVNGDNGYIDNDEREHLQGGITKSNNKIKTLGELDQLAKGGISVNVPSERFQDTDSGGINGGELKSAFNPQIIINGMSNGSNNDGAAGLGMHNSNLLLNNQQSSVNASSISSSVSSATNNYNISGMGGVPRVIDEYLKPRSDIFSGNNPTPGTDPFEWMTRFFNQNGGSGSSNDTATCPIQKPYAEEGRGRFNTATLTNRTYVPGMAYMPPTEWNVPQYHPTTCRQVCNNTFIDTRALPIGIMDPGTPIFALEIGSDGTIAKTEDDVTLTNVGSIMPKFTYREYVDCPQMCQDSYMPTTTTTRPVTTTTGFMPTTTTLSATTTTTRPVTTTTGFMPTTTTLPATTTTTGFMPTTTTRPVTTTTGFMPTTTQPVTTTTQPVTTTTGFMPTTTTQPVTTTTTGFMPTTTTQPVTTATTGFMPTTTVA